MKDIYNSVLVKETLAIAARINGTVNGTGVDRNEDASMYQGAMVIVHTGTITDGSHAIDIQESDDNVTFTSVAAADLQGTKPTIGAPDDNKVYEIGYRGTKRYVRATVVTTGATTGGVFGATVVQADPRVLPVIRN